MKWLARLRSLTAEASATQPCGCSDKTPSCKSAQPNLEQQLYLSKPWF